MTPEGVNPEVWDRAVAWARRMADAEDEFDGDIGVGGLAFEVQKFPKPDTDGMSAEEAERMTAEWRTALRTWRERQARRTQTDPARESA